GRQIMEVVDIRMTHAPGYGVPGEAGQPFLVAFVEQLVTGLILWFYFHIPHGG
ncbi:hypothetical protein WKU_04752, partial [Escherichia coli KTE177]